MEQRRFVLFVTISMVVWFVWINVLVPRIFQLPERNPIQVSESSDFDEPLDALSPSNVTDTQSPSETPAIIAVSEKHPDRTLWIGPEDNGVDRKNAEYFLAVKLDSRGASVDAIELTDRERYPAFGRRDKRIRLIESSPKSDFRTFQVNVPEIDELLKSEKLDQISWEVTEEQADSATFRLQSPDGKWELTKRFRVARLTDEQQQQTNARDTLASGYQLYFTMGIRNLTDHAQELSYKLRGPVGIALEDKDTSYKYRDIRMGFRDEDGVTIDESHTPAADIVKQVKNQKTELSKRPVKYIGIDVLYFAALLLPQNDQLKDRTIEKADCLVVSEDAAYPKFSDITVDLTSTKIDVGSKNLVTHDYVLYAGPKIKTLVQQVSAGAIMDYGWFDSICRGMVWLLNAFHGIGISYGISILCLTALVRTLLIPISKYQAIHAAKMKELQPRIAARQKEIEAKYGKNTDEYMKASQELVAEQTKVMFGGCLPAFLQLPIFIALYRVFGSSIELRMEPFLWFENLASPDSIYKFGFALPLLGWTELNLLPVISAAIMFVQQKLTMPPPTNEEQAVQQKTMSVTMIVMMLWMFYRVPSGLCIYFIGTNLWGIVERKLIDRKLKMAPPVKPADPAPVVTKGAEATPAPEKKSTQLASWWNEMLEKADKEVSLRKDQRIDNEQGNRKNKKKRGRS